MSWQDSDEDCECACAEKLKVLMEKLEYEVGDLQNVVEELRSEVGELRTEKEELRREKEKLRSEMNKHVQEQALRRTPEAQEPPALHVAASSGDVDAVRRLAASGEDLTARDVRGDTALHCAAAEGQVAALSALLELVAARLPDGLDSTMIMSMVANARGRHLRSPLHAAAAHGHADAARTLLAAGANPQVDDARGNHALHLAAAGGHHDVAELLLAKGANVNAVGHEGYTPLDSAARAGHVSLMLLLLGRGAHLAQNVGSFGAPTLVAAATGGNPEAIRVILQRGKYECTENKWIGGVLVPSVMTRAVYEAAKGGHTLALKILLEYGAGVNASFNNESPLLVAVRGGHAETVNLLLARGAFCNAFPYGSFIASDIMTSYLVAAAESGNPNVIKALYIALYKKTTNPASRLPVQFNSYSYIPTEMVQSILEHARNAAIVWAVVDIEPNAFPAAAANSLCALAEKGNAEVLRAVLLTGVDVQNDECVEALKKATEKKRAECVAALLRAGVREKDDLA